jgi:hypothetical protein
MAKFKEARRQNGIQRNTAIAKKKWEENKELPSTNMLQI